jgi:hypothetical protein
MSMHIKVEICDGDMPSLIRESMKQSKMNSLPIGKRGEFAKAMKEREEYGEEEDDDDGDEPPMDRGSPPPIPVKKTDFAPEVVKKVMPPMPKGVKASKGKK